MKLHRWDHILNLIADIEYPVGAEIGVHRGECSHALLSARRDLTLYLVDPWSPESYAEKGDDAAPPESRENYQARCNEHFEFTRQLIKPYFSRVHIYHDYSLNVAAWIKDEMFDFVFIDGAHDYESVRADICAWYPKLKPGGYMCGHDYGLYDGVTRAVDELFTDVKIDTDYFWSVKL